MLNGKYDQDLTPPVQTPNQARTRGNYMRLTKPKFTKKIRKNYFSIRVTNLCNELPEKVIQAPSVKSFEDRLYKFWSKFKIKCNSDK